MARDHSVQLIPWGHSVQFIPRGLGWFATFAVFLFWILGVLIPLGALFFRLESFNSREALFSSETLSLVRVTFDQAFLSTWISGALGLCLGLWIGGRAGRASSWAESLLAVPFGIPSVVVALGWVLLLGRAGLLARFGISLDWAYSMKAVILAHVFLNLPWVALLVAQSRRSLPVRPLEAAATLGAGPFRRFFSVIFPHVRWAFFSACAQVFGLCVMSFALVMILGGGPPVQTLESALYTRLRYGELDLSGAVIYALWQLFLTLIPWVIVLLIQFKSEAQKTLLSSPSLHHEVSRVSGASFRIVDGAQLASVLFLIAPYFLIFSNLKLNTVDFKNLTSEIGPALRVSFEMAGSTAFGSVFMAAFAIIALLFLERWPRFKWGISILVLLPAGISTMVLGLGAWLAYGKWVDPFSGSAPALIAVIGVQTVVFFPIAFRVLWPVSQTMPVGQFEAAATLGCSPFKAFWLLDWPRWRNPVLSAFAVVMAASLGEVAAASLFYHEDLITLPVLLSRWMARYRFEDAQVLAAFFLILSLLVVVFIMRSRSRVRLY